MITLEVLLRLQSMLAEQLAAADDFVLGDYFDYIRSTGTGAMIAAELAEGLDPAVYRSFLAWLNGERVAYPVQTQ